MTSLPIDTLRADFLRQIEHHHLIVEAETGSGKSTRLPLWMASKGRVLVVEPRRIACTSLAEYLAQQSDKPLGDEIGYAIKLDNCYRDETQVVFVTPGVALRWLAEDGLAQFDLVMVDEFHERRWDTDLLVALLRVRQSHRLVVTSATIEGDKLANYLDAKRLYASGRRFDVHLEHDCLDSRQLPDNRNLEQKVKRQVQRLLDSATGDILVFLPGRKEIQACAQTLAGLEDVLIAPLHASVSEAQKQLALNPQRQRKVVLATNVAETSLTIPNIVAVIDSGLERRNEQRNGKTALALKHISKASARQRLGRAGRVMAGTCVRLYGEHAALAEVTPPQMHRESLTEPMLAAACCQTPLERLAFLEPLPEKSLLSAQSILRSMGAIDEQGVALEHGKKLYPLPIDALYADLVTRMPSKALQEAMIDLTAALAVPGRLFSLPRQVEALEQLEREEPLGCDGELLIGLLRSRVFSGVDCDLDALQEARALAEQMREVFELPQLSVASRYKHSDLVEAIARLHSELVFVRREKRRESMANGKMEVTIGRDSRFKASDEAAIVLDTHSVPARGVKNTLNLATVILPIPLAKVAQLELGEWQSAEPNDNEQLSEQGLMVTLQHIYAGRVIATCQQPAEGAHALNAIITAVKQQQIWPGFAKLRETQIKHYQLYTELGYSLDEVTDCDFSSWFGAQLEQLGVTTLEELALFEPQELAFAGIPEWEYADFAEAYPFELQLSDIKLQVEYFARRKLVQVIYRSGQRKGDPKRWELPSWSGWRIQYKKASRVVDVR
ncbi:DEAD/DEAH box helicase [Vibrio xiamenensis]|uniref:DEAD/DEAH box helicase n=1 Tax=Vibrio xiamenensis TaxID=861298 RepID=A0A1G7ZP31_9VIBR|nr:helicase-related protein [Vibrio xiamenensis]SDH10434.1 DEAD/DEAH box helicase [Vibrio xiamenensis]